MTERIYYTDPGCRSFDAVVLRCFSHDGRDAVVLDRTAFYPTSGGQPFDTGRLAGVQVLETIDAEDDIVHVVSAPLAPGTEIRGEIDWARRADHMQQHTGQHVLSAAFDHLFENRTLSFHMGAETCSIDLARELPAADVERAVDAANQVVWEDRPVGIRFASTAEAASLPLRKEPARGGELRLIEVEGYDLSACGGTHVARTGSIGVIAALATERFKGGMRVTFVCGARALRSLRLYRDAVAGSVRLLSVLPPELPAAIDRLQRDGKEMRKTLGRFQEQLAGQEAARLRTLAEDIGGMRVLVRALDGWDAAGLKLVASALASEPGIVAVLFSTSTPAFVAVASRPGDSGGGPPAADAGEMLRELTRRFGGRGGGKADLAQGGGLTGHLDEMLAAARALIG